MTRPIVNGRTGLVIALAAIALTAALPLVLGEFYVNISSQIICYALFALGVNLIVGYGGMTSLGHASFFGIAAYGCTWLVTVGNFGFLPASLLALVITTICAGVFGVQLPDDHLGARPDRLGRGLSLGRPDPRRQRHAAGWPAEAVRHLDRRRDELLLFLAAHLRRRPVLHLAHGQFAVRRRVARCARPASAHAHARP
jgi:hypothetical protein